MMYTINRYSGKSFYPATYHKAALVLVTNCMRKELNITFKFKLKSAAKSKVEIKCLAVVSAVDGLNTLAYLCVSNKLIV